MKTDEKRSTPQRDHRRCILRSTPFFCNKLLGKNRTWGERCAELVKGKSMPTNLRACQQVPRDHEKN